MKCDNEHLRKTFMWRSYKLLLQKVLVSDIGDIYVPSMIEKNHGHIVALSSIVAFLTGKHGTSYCSTKAGVTGIT